MQLTKNQLAFLLAFKKRLRERSFLITTFNMIKNRKTVTFPEEELSSITDRFTKQLPVVSHRVSNEQGKYLPGGIHLFQYKHHSLYVYVDNVTSIKDISDSPYYKYLSTSQIELISEYPLIDVVTFKMLSTDTSIPPLGITDSFNINKGDIVNFNKTTELTSVGRLLLNQLILVEPFNDIIPYVNDVWDQSSIEKQIAILLLNKKVSVAQFKLFINNVYFLGHFTELVVPALTRQAMTTHPKVKARKAELFKQYAGKLNDPAVIQIIEKELIDLDKEHLKGDGSIGFYDGVGSKAYNVHRKKLFLTVGGIDKFSENSGDYEFIPNSLQEGWDKESFPVICNEIRKGSFSRGKETAKGGELTAYLARVFQNLRISVSDCGTNKGILVTLNDKNIFEYYGRHVVDKNSSIITKENASSFINKPILLRSPMYCKTKGGFCFNCVGETFRTLDFKALGMLPSAIGSTLLTASMKQMHGTKLASSKIDYKEYFV